MHTKVGNLLKEVKSGIIVHGCNAQGVMGAGFAAQVRSMYPELFKQYQLFCHRAKGTTKGSALGEAFYYRVDNDLIIANAITQLGFNRERRQTDYEAIASCFESIGKAAKQNDMEVHFPMIGAGLGGGNWKVISAIIEVTLDDLEVDYTLWVLP